jgi:hypothetical protein
MCRWEVVFKRKWKDFGVLLFLSFFLLFFPNKKPKQNKT